MADGENTSKTRKLTPWKPSVAPNMAGAGLARTRITNKFLRDMGEYYDVHGPQIIHEVRVKDPVALLNIVAKLLPKEAHLSIDAQVSVDLTKDQRMRIAEAWMLGQSDQLEALEGEAVRIIEESRERTDFSRTNKPAIPAILSEADDGNGDPVLSPDIKEDIKEEAGPDIKDGNPGLFDDPLDNPPPRKNQEVPKLRRGQRAVMSRRKGKDD